VRHGYGNQFVETQPGINVKIGYSLICEDTQKKIFEILTANELIRNEGSRDIDWEHLEIIHHR
jgi:hypothetical protein